MKSSKIDDYKNTEQLLIESFEFDSNNNATINKSLLIPILMKLLREVRKDELAIFNDKTRRQKGEDSEKWFMRLTEYLNKRLVEVDGLMKECYLCKVIKPIRYFSVNSAKFGGLNHICKICDNNRRSIHYENNKSTEKYKLKHRITVAEWNKYNRLKTKAHGIAHRKVTPKDQCERCLSKDRLHMHHPDYSKPTEVITLCNKCHEQEHHGVIL